jgi:toxin ParE1/3/4
LVKHDLFGKPVSTFPDHALRIVVAHIARWPESMRRSKHRPDVRVAPLGRFPHKIFYRVRAETIEILHIYHVAREPWDEQER